MYKLSTPTTLQLSKTKSHCWQPNLIASITSLSPLAIPAKMRSDIGVAFKGELILRGRRHFTIFIALMVFIVFMVFHSTYFSTLWLQYFGFKMLGYFVLWILGCFSYLNYSLICTFAYVAQYLGHSPLAILVKKGEQYQGSS